ncbi:VWA domain-containing protein [Bacillus inaquosorum]|uniref:vWA domain-containing protein n=1 Tax=Bacillus inaquosorum TaxID=483913 RepID=UPI0022822A83|nr:VWA domain-containing protein [Bacillus inaquosorum]MCY8145184.1 VWA domain-containing protein [Bacillus inaquosorum]MCY8849199.1 VWA domain-containing protein [Bacillus inaquosorum]MCY8852671.1 VWA domain-containing protein [Bacillus inaquosorum]MCY8869696.1 VWA domain-containing protein [Bacillus inaquosorum]MEC0573973.1 VWA domain-containing protein [Bacillus inaquosorum]
MATIDLQKKSVKIVLEKKQLTKVTARVGLVLDITGSMRTLYKNGTVQNVVERILAVADQFDDNGLLDVWVYDNEFSRLKPVSEKDFSGYVDREILNNDRLHKFGRNDEPPVMKDVLRKYVAEEPSSYPAFIVLINDGGCKKSIKPIIEASSDKPVFWQFVGIGNGNFDFLNKLDTLEGRAVDNTNFLHIEEIDSISDEELYDALLTEFPFWLKEAKEKGIIRDQEPPAEKPKKKGFFSRLFSK